MRIYYLCRGIETGNTTFINMEMLPTALAGKLEQRKKANALRSLPLPRRGVDFTSNDYLGLAKNETIYKGAMRLVNEHGLAPNGASGSRLLSGNHPLYELLESRLEAVYGQAALVFNSGYDANTGFFSSVPARQDIVLYDEFVHASIRDGIRMGLAKSYRYSHNDMETLTHLLRKQRVQRKEGEIYLVTESVFSMDGDSPDLKTLLRLAAEFQCRLVVDEAHAVGVWGSQGEGLLGREEVFARVITFGKALGCQGAAILGSARLKDYLINFARSFIYTTALPPFAVACIICAWEMSVGEEGSRLREELWDRIAFFKETLTDLGLGPHFLKGNAAIHSCMRSGNILCKESSHALQKEGFDVRPILSPTVAPGGERLRFCLHAYNSRDEIQKVLQLLSPKLSNP